MILIVSLFKAKEEKCIENDVKIRIFTFMFLNADITINILSNIFKLSVVVLNTIMEGTVSQISFPCPKSNFMQFRKSDFQKLLNVSRF